MTETSVKYQPLKLSRAQERILQLVQFIGLLELKRICDAYNLKYTLAFGSLIGAVRHHGFIPWDDDIDVTMPRDDFNRLKEICKSDLGSEFFLQSPETDKNYTLSIMRLRINNTKLVEQGFINWNIHNGIAVDIYPCDHLPDNKIKRFFYKYVSKYMLTSTQLICSPPINRKSMVKKILAAVLPLPLRVFKREKLLQLRDRYLSKYDKLPTKEIMIQEGEQYKEKHIYPSDYFLQRINVKFEFDIFPIPSNYDFILSKNYGDYMKAPPIEMRCQHHGFIDVDFGKYDSLDVIQEIYNKYGVTTDIDITSLSKNELHL